ncbi:hypothetical protein I5E95_06105 [Proteus mirabilis]|nr:hypothetical protein [Proteus mirabilis]MBG5977504.1 hypothetical protein [Proteus mirabilis]
MFEQVNIIYGEIVKKMTVMVGDFSQKEILFAKNKIGNLLAQRDVGKIYQLKVAKFKEKLAILTFKVNNSQQIEQFSDLIIKAKGIYRVYISSGSINRRNIVQKNSRFSYLNVAQGRMNLLCHKQR